MIVTGKIKGLAFGYQRLIIQDKEAVIRLLTKRKSDRFFSESGSPSVA